MQDELDIFDAQSASLLCCELELVDVWSRVLFHFWILQSRSLGAFYNGAQT